MSALSEVATHVGSPQACTICGTRILAGGMWMGATDIFICGSGCASKLLQLTLDTLYDTEGHVVRWVDWMKMAQREYDRWEHGKRVQQRTATQFHAGRVA